MAADNFLMAKTKEEKEKILDNLRDYLKKQKSMAFFSFSGLKMEDFSVLRQKVREKKSIIKVIKKTLFRLASKDDYPDLSEKMGEIKEQFAVMLNFSDDFSSLKDLYEISKEKEGLKILGGYFEDKFLGVEETKELAKIPPRKELLRKLVYIVSAPQRNFVNVLDGNIRKLLVVFSSIVDKKGH